MNKDLQYWLWMQKALGEGAHIKSILEDFSSAKELYNSNILEWRMSPSLTTRQIEKLSNTDIDSVYNIIAQCEQNGWDIVAYDDSRYPERLKQISNPPAVLYVDGKMPNIDNTAVIGIVGTRKASNYSIKVTHIMSRGITEGGALVVSGGALGVDTAAHKGALIAGGKTIAVLGCGLGTEYLNANKSLRKTISENGALITEYPPFTKASRITFPMRNRIISGLSVGLLVVEAGVKSGSLITANYAIEQGRDVFAIPASVLSTDFAGTNKLIEDGAMVATSPHQILAPYAEKFDSVNLAAIRSIDELVNDESDKSANVDHNDEKSSFENVDKSREIRTKNEQTAMGLKGNLKTVLECLDGNFKQIDLIIEETGTSSSNVISALTQLEIMGLVKSASGKRYKLA